MTADAKSYIAIARPARRGYRRCRRQRARWKPGICSAASRHPAQHALEPSAPVRKLDGQGETQQEKSRSRAHGSEVAGRARQRFVADHLRWVHIDKEMDAFDELVARQRPILCLAADRTSRRPSSPIPSRRIVPLAKTESAAGCARSISSSAPVRGIVRSGQARLGLGRTPMRGVPVRASAAYAFWHAPYDRAHRETTSQRVGGSGP